MSCLKCGREVTGSQVFCDSCLDTMAQYPITAGVAVHLPSRSLNPDLPAAAKKRPPTPEELLAKARKENKRLRRWVVLLCIALVLGAVAVVAYKFRDPLIENIGRNYTTYIN